MRIGQLARSVGVDTQTIRFYEREGLLPPPDRQDNGKCGTIQRFADFFHPQTTSKTSNAANYRHTG